MHRATYRAEPSVFLAGYRARDPEDRSEGWLDLRRSAFRAHGAAIHTRSRDARAPICALWREQEPDRYARLAPNVGDVRVDPAAEYVRQITYYDALLYTNTYAYRVRYAARCMGKGDSFMSRGNAAARARSSFRSVGTDRENRKVPLQQVFLPR
jgi:hypothetical protein